MNTAAPPQSAARGWTRSELYFLAILVLVNATNYMDRGVLSILQEPLKRDLALSDLQLGMVSGPAFALLYVTASIPIARLAERRNRITILSIAAAVWSGATMACGLAVNYAQLFLARVMVGLGEGACSPASYSLVGDYFPARQRGMAMAVLTTSIPIAGFLAPVLGGSVAETWGWRWAFAAMGLPGVLLAVLMLLTLKDPRRGPAAMASAAAERTTLFSDLRLLLSQPAYVFLWFAAIFLGVGIGGTNIFTASFFIREFGMSLAQAGLVTGVSLGVAGLAGTFVGGYLADRFAGARGRSYILLPGIGAGLAGVFFLLAFTQEAWIAAVVFVVAANFATDLKNGTLQAAIQNMSPPHMRATTAAFSMFGVTLFGTAAGPLVVGAASDRVAAATFAAGSGAYETICQVKAIAPGMVEACRAASAQGMQTGLVIVSVAYFAAMILFFVAAFLQRKPLSDS